MKLLFSGARKGSISGPNRQARVKTGLAGQSEVSWPIFSPTQERTSSSGTKSPRVALW